MARAGGSTVCAGVNALSRTCTWEGAPAAAGPIGCVSDWTIVSLAAVTWDFRLVGRTRMLTEAWLRAGQATLFVQVPSLRSGVQRLLGQLRRPDNAPVLRPWPVLPARWWKSLGTDRLRQLIRRRAPALRRQLQRCLDWDRAAGVVVSPVWTPWLGELPFRCVVYDCIDELAVHITRPELADLYRDWEDELISRASGAVATAQVLADGLRRRRPDLPTTVIRNGVDVERFQRLASASPRPADVPRSGRPIVGFVGALYDWIDWELIRRTAQRLADVDFVFVGPHDRRGNPRVIASLPNVHLLGARPYTQVPAYVDAFTVGWVPFTQDAIGAAANPVKIYEYLALGKPVVTTPVADTESFGDLVTVARTADEMTGRLRAAISEGTARAAQRVAFARDNSWDRRAQDYTTFLRSLS